MTQTANLTLPIRLRPLKGGQGLLLLAYGAFTGIVLYWMAKHAGFLERDIPTLAEAFKRIGVVQFLVLAFFGVSAGKGLVTTILKLLPGSPYYYLEINEQGLANRHGFKTDFFPWRDLAPFETLRVEKSRRKGGVRVDYYTVSMGADQSEVLRIFAEEYGAKNDEQDAADLAAWLNELRDLALQHKLSAAQSVAVPGGFVESAVAL